MNFHRCGSLGRFFGWGDRLNFVGWVTLTLNQHQQLFGFHVVQLHLHSLDCAIGNDGCRAIGLMLIINGWESFRVWVGMRYTLGDVPVARLYGVTFGEMEIASGLHNTCHST